MQDRIALERRRFLRGAGALALGGYAVTLPFQAKAKAKAQAAGERLKLTLLGQALIEHEVSPSLWRDRPRIASRLAQADVCFTNFESVIRGPNEGAPTRELLTLHAADASILGKMKALGINLLSNANNHAFDLNTGGIIDTLDAAARAGMPLAGTGRDLRSATQAAVLETKRGRVAVVAFATGKVRDGGAALVSRAGVNEIRSDSANRLDESDIVRNLDAVAEARKTADIVIACHHNHLWEPNNADIPLWQRPFARRFIDAGATSFVGHGAPVFQGIEVYRGAPIFYSLGNFFFQTEKEVGAYPPANWEGAIVETEWLGSVCKKVKLVPITMNELGYAAANDHSTRGMPSFATPQQGQRIMRRIVRQSSAFGARFRFHPAGIGELLLSRTLE